MSDIAGAADAAAEGVSAPATEIAVEADPAPRSQPLGSQIPPADKSADAGKDKPSATAGDAIARAQEAVRARNEAKAAEAAKTPVPKEGAKPDAKEPSKAEQPRGQDGKFAPTIPPAEAAKPAETAPAKPAAESKPTQFADAPQRFSTDAKAAWHEAPEPVRAEVHRAVRELEQGFEKHRAEAQAFAELKEFDDLAKQSGTTLKAALANYVGMEQALKQDPVAGIDNILGKMGISLKDFAAHVLQQPADQQSSRQDATVRALQQEIAQLKQQFGGVSQTIEQQRAEAVMSQINAFIAQPGHERFDELGDDIRFFLETGKAANLSDAYQLAERLNPAPAQAPAAVPVTPPEPDPPTPVPLNPAGQKSISGAPSSGSDPVQRTTPIPSIEQALKRAMARAG